MNSSTTISGSSRSLWRSVTSWFFLHACTSTSPVSVCRDTSTCPAEFCCPTEHSVSRMLQDNAMDYSYHPGKHHTFIGHHSVSGIPAASQFNPFCSWFFLPSMPDILLCHKLALPSSYQLNFPFSCLDDDYAKDYSRSLRNKKIFERIVIQTSVKLTSEVM